MVSACRWGKFFTYRYSKFMDMMSEQESRIVREIEDEVLRLVSMTEELDRKISKELATHVKIRHMSILRDKEELVGPVSKGEVVFASLDGLEDGVLKKAVTEIKEEVEKIGGKIYFVSRPILLLLPPSAQIYSDL